MQARSEPGLLVSVFMIIICCECGSALKTNNCMYVVVNDR